MRRKKNRMAGGDNFQAGLRNAQMQGEMAENNKTAQVIRNSQQAQGMPKPPAATPAPKAPAEPEKAQEAQNFLTEKKEEVKNKYSRGSDLKEIGKNEAGRSFASDLDPELAKQAQQGRDFGPKDLARYRELYDKKYGAGASDSAKMPEVTEEPKVPEAPAEEKKGGRKYGPSPYDGKEKTFAQQAIDAAKANNPVDFKELDQRIHDRSLYTQAQADIKHSEIFGDTWAWDKPFTWNTDRFKAEEQENRYADVMEENKYD